MLWDTPHHQATQHRQLRGTAPSAPRRSLHGTPCVHRRETKADLVDADVCLLGYEARGLARSPTAVSEGLPADAYLPVAHRVEGGRLEVPQRVLCVAELHFP